MKKLYWSDIFYKLCEVCKDCSVLKKQNNTYILRCSAGATIQLLTAGVGWHLDENVYSGMSQLAESYFGQDVALNLECVTHVRYQHFGYGHVPSACGDSGVKEQLAEI
ncbi:hypothetical protein G4B88_027884 [Cannabis sativa]|uniref:Uncharacterized protein n=1 Tax=Cannabis sativa TaxID=3483 RepID=A0A7J6I6D4_CANSA|nr:hypothetical protein G4B88_027884 [Cannabis sativa]